MKKIKILVSILIIAVLMLSIPVFSVDAATEPSYVTLKQIHNKPNATTASIDAEIKVIKDSTGCKVQNSNNNWLNPFVYDDYDHLVVYGIPSGDFVGDFYERADGKMRYNGKAGEYKYLGENADGALVTNDRYYPEGTQVGSIFPNVQSYKDIKWNDVTGAYTSWQGLSKEQKEVLSDHYFSDDDYYGTCVNGDEVKLTLSELLGSDLTKKALVQVAPSFWSVSGSVRLEYDPGHWDSVIFKPLAPNTLIKASITAQDTYTMTADMDSIDVPYTVNGTVSGDIVINNMLGKLKELAFKSFSILQTKDFSNELVTQHAQFTKTYSRSELKEGINTKTLTASATVTTIMPNDEPKTADAEKPINIIVLPKIIPPSTGNIEVRCIDSLTNTLIPYTGSTITNVPYGISKTISSPPVDGYSAIGSYSVYNGSSETTSISNMQRGTLSQSVTLSSTSKNAYVYFWYDVIKGPVAYIDGPTKVKAGNDFDLSGSRSYCKQAGATIVKYHWSVPITGVSGTTSFGSPGIYTVKLTVTDSNGLTGSTTHDIEVTPPTPTARFSLSGKTKENRKITIDAGTSDSPDNYPIDWPRTTWKIEPDISTGATWEMGVRLSDGTVKTIDQNTDQSILNGQSILYFQARYAGNYNVTLSVTNTYPASNTYKGIIVVVKDLAPISEIDVQASNLRENENPVDNTKRNYGVIPVVDHSYSPDGDTIGKRTWSYRYNSLNNKDVNGNPIFTDDITMYKFNGNLTTLFEMTEGQRLVVDSDNDSSIELWTYDVGKYKVMVLVEESIPDNETIKELLLPTDIRTSIQKGW
jgi:hypothetical protein